MGCMNSRPGGNRVGTAATGELPTIKLNGNDTTQVTEGGGGGNETQKEATKVSGSGT